MTTFNSSPLGKLKWNRKKLSKEVEQDLIKRYQETKDEEAITILIENHIAMIKNVVAKAKPPQSYFDDAIIEGILGFLVAVEKYNPNFDTRLSTYSMIWIKLYVQRFLDSNVSAIYVPVNKTQELKRAVRKSKESDTPIPEEVREILKNRELLSLDYTVNIKDNQDKTLLDILADTMQSPEDYSNEQLLREDVFNVFDALSPKESLIVQRYFGISGPQKNFVELSKELGVSHQRCQQIFQRAINKLREPPLVQEFAKIALEYGIVSQQTVNELLTAYEDKTNKSIEVYWKKKSRASGGNNPNYKKKTRGKNIMNYSSATNKTSKGTIIPVISKSRPYFTNKRSKNAS